MDMCSNCAFIFTLFIVNLGFLQSSKHGDLQDILNDMNMDISVDQHQNHLRELVHHRLKRQEATQQQDVQRKLTIELGITLDKRAADAISETSNSEKYVYDVMKILDRRMALLNMSAVLTELEVWNKKDEMLISENRVSNLLRTWSAKREQKVEQHWTDMSVLITGYNFAAVGDPINGLATQSTMCVKKAGVVVLYKGQSLNRMAQTILHEIGHTLSMGHDSTTCCSEGYNKCAMGPTLNDYQVTNPKFSPCSLQSFAKFLKSGQSQCLDNIPTEYPMKTSQSLCGNGILDPGEQCDCGGGCLYGCCNCCKQCRLIAQARCASGPCCDTSSCQLRPPTFVCRNDTIDSCNPADYCTGNSNECPPIKTEDGTLCTDKYNVKSVCLNGRCMTRNTQCEKYWSSDYREGSERCYIAGVTMLGRFAHCGQISENRYIRCMPYGNADFYKCGMLQCTGPDDDLYEVTSFPQSPQKNIYITDTPCLTLSHGPWETKEGDVMVEDGTNCGANKLCYHGSCLEMDVVLPNVINRTEDNSTLPNNTLSYCGNGIIEDTEDCDCAPEQCDCCDFRTCQFRQNREGCYSNECLSCNGTSQECSIRHLPIMTSCDNGTGQCYDGQCSSLSITCRKYFGEFAVPVLNLYSLNARSNTSTHNGGGYILFNRKTRRWHNFNEFQVADNDGTCGLLYCKAYVAANVTNDKGQVLSSRTYTVQGVNSHRVAYFSFETTRDGENLYDKFYPLLTDNGTPCTKNGEKGYCTRTSLQLDRKHWNWYWTARCIVPQSI